MSEPSTPPVAGEPVPDPLRPRDTRDALHLEGLDERPVLPAPEPGPAPTR